MQASSNKTAFEKITTILPKPESWHYTPDPLLIEECSAIQDYIYINKQFAPVNEAIDINAIKKYEGLFAKYSELVELKYLNEDSEEYCIKIYDQRIKNRKVSNPNFEALVQFIYEAQCALTEFYVFISKYHVQYRTALFPLFYDYANKNLEVYMRNEMAEANKKPGAYTREQAERLGSLYTSYVKASYEVKLMLGLISDNPEYAPLMDDMDFYWLTCGYFQMTQILRLDELEQYYDDVYPEYIERQYNTFTDLSKALSRCFTQTKGSCHTLDEHAFSFDVDAMFKPNNQPGIEMREALDGAMFPSSYFDKNCAAVSISSVMPNHYLDEQQVFAFEVSLYSSSTMSLEFGDLFASFLVFGGIFNNIQDNLIFPLVFHLQEKQPNDKELIECYKGYFYSLTTHMSLFYENILYLNTLKCYENQFLKRQSQTRYC